MTSICSNSSSSIWARRIANKSAPCLATSAASWASASTSRDEQVELNVRSLLLNLPLHTLSLNTRINAHEQVHRSAPQNIPQPPMSPVEMHTAQTAVKAALDVLLNEDVPMDEPARPHKFPQLRISTNHATLSAPLSPLSPGQSSFDSPLLSPAESCFSSSSDADVSAEDEEGAEPKRKGRARMSQEKRKRLARRREREAALLLASQQQQQQQQHFYPQQQQQQMQIQMQHCGFTRSAPVSPVLPRSPFSATNAIDSFFFTQTGADQNAVSPVGSLSAFAQKSALDMMPALSSSPTSSPSSSAASSPLGHMLLPISPIGSSRSARPKSPSPPTLVIQPPSPQRLLLKQSQQQYHSFQHQSFHYQQQQQLYTAQSAYHF